MIARPRMRLSGTVPVLLGLGLWACLPLAAQVPQVGARSHSGQFVLVASSTARTLNVGTDPRLTNKNSVALSPMLVPISCERVKQFVANELGVTTPWQGKILISLRPAVPNDRGVLITANGYQNSWQYHVDLPTPIDRTIYIRAIVRVVLMEMANRTAGGVSTDPPAWLVEGLARHVLASRQIEVILSQPGSFARGVTFTQAMVSEVQDNPLKESHGILIASGALNFEELSWPAPGSFEGPEAPRFAASAHAFTLFLLRLQNSKVCFRAWLENMPRYLNWQTSFFAAFKQYFQAPLDVEKWWALQTTFLGRQDVAKSWARSESEAAMQELLQVPVRVHSSSNALPIPKVVSIQTVLREWDDEQQNRVIERKLRELEMLRLRVSPDYLPTIESYHRVLLEALQKRRSAGGPFGIGRSSGLVATSAKAAFELDQLNALRAAPVTNASPTPPAENRTIR